MQKIIDTIALVICTRNRDTYMSGLLANLTNLDSIPCQIVIVDSSDDKSTLNLLSKLDKDLATKIKYIESAPGLPHQRNVGIQSILKSESSDQIEIISFTDDDCRLAQDYFEHLSIYLKNHSNFSGISGISVPIQARKPSLWRRLFYLDSKISGRILKSGYTTPIYCTDGICEVEWIPGGSMNIRKKILENTLFDSNLRMYGEDLKMSLVLKEYGPLLAHSKMEYRHLEASSGKDNLIDIISFTDGIRWQLAKEYPGKIKRRFILLSTIGSVMANALGFIKSRNFNAESKSICIGHLQFLYRLMKSSQYVQINR